MRPKLLTVCALTITLVSCDHSPTAPAGLSLRMSSPYAAAADPVKATLDNQSGGWIEFQVCTTVLQRRVGSQWVSVEDISCTSTANAVRVQNRLGASQQLSITHPIPAHAETGAYRLSLELLGADGSAAGHVYSDAFHVDFIVE